MTMTGPDGSASDGHGKEDTMEQDGTASRYGAVYAAWQRDPEGWWSEAAR